MVKRVSQTPGWGQPIARAVRTRGFVRDSVATVGRAHAGVEKIGDAIIGGDRTGEARGSGAIDVQSSRSSAVMVGSGDGAVVFGHDNTVSAAGGIALGYLNTVDGVAGIALGRLARAGPAAAAVAIGSEVLASGIESVALGAGAAARVWHTVNLGGALIVKRSEASYTGEWFGDYAAAEVALLTDEVDLKGVADYGYTLPAGCHFWVESIGIICTKWSAITNQPTIRMGQNEAGKYASLLAAVKTTGLTAAYKRQNYSPLITADGLLSLSAGVTVGATGTLMRGRFMFRGLLVEDEAA